jgi:hypothetical protein
VSVTLLEQLKSAVEHQIDIVSDFLVVSEHHSIRTVCWCNQSSILDDSLVVQG